MESKRRSAAQTLGRRIGSAFAALRGVFRKVPVKPSIRYLSNSRMVLSRGAVLVECQYLLHWGDGIWNIDVRRVQGMGADDASIAAFIVQLMAHPKWMLVITQGGRTIYRGQPHPATPLPDTAAVLANMAPHDYGAR